VNYLYDGSGNRVAMQSTVNGTTTLTSYIGSIEEVQTTGSSTQTTYYALGDQRVAADVNGTFYYFGYDALGSQVAVLNATGSLVGAQLYGPYEASRYNTGTLPTSIWFTGQRADTITGLDYYNARYYDPGVGQFLSVDSVQGNIQGMDPYAYVGGNPESRTDPTGNNCYDPTTQTVKVGCGNNKTDPPVQSGGGGGIDFQPPRQNNGGDTGGGGGTTTTQPNPPSPPARPTQSPKPSSSRSKGQSNNKGCNVVCTRDKTLINKALEDQLQHREAGVSIFTDLTSLWADLQTMGYDADIFGAELIDMVSLLVHLAQFGVDIAAWLGSSVPSGLSYVIGLANTIINSLDAIKGVLEFFNPGGLVGKLIQPFLDAAKPFLEAQSSNLIPGISQLLGDVTDKTLEFQEAQQEDQVANYTTSQAYNACQQYYAPGAC
jgi:RHS repeat-associated protein